MLDNRGDARTFKGLKGGLTADIVDLIYGLIKTFNRGDRMWSLRLVLLKYSRVAETARIQPGGRT